MDELDNLLTDLASAASQAPANVKAAAAPRTSPQQIPQTIGTPMKSASSADQLASILQAVASSNAGAAPRRPQAEPKPVPTPGRGVEAVGECHTCHQPIDDKVLAVRALNHYYHPHHFQCTQCKVQLPPTSFFERDRRPYCDQCIQNILTLPTCAYCNEPVQGRCVNALDRQWHPEHFFCCQCGKVFGAGAAFLEKDGKAYCEEDYNGMFAPKCTACGESIGGEVVSALGGQYHERCFVCAEAGCDVSLLDSGSFYEHGGRPYCERHYHLARGSMCATCQQPIVGRCLTAFGKKFHPDHFQCTQCRKLLTIGGNASGGGATFKEHRGEPFCVPCHIKRFG